jgi:predicted SPOUT superfamily RNA methylase MTH1
MTSTILIPSSVVREATDKRDATRKLGTIARAATIFGIDRIGVFSDPEGEGRWGAPFITRVLRYAATPASDRTRRSAEAGSGSQGPGSLIDGIVTEVGSEGRVWVNCELQHPLALIAPPEVGPLDEGDRVTIRISSRDPLQARIVERAPATFAVEAAALDALLGRPDAGVPIATSRHGTPLTQAHLAALTTAIAEDGMTVVFGAPGRGLLAMADADPDALAAGMSPLGVDHWLRSIPRQHTDVVRTEEAVMATLACLAIME